MMDTATYLSYVTLLASLTTRHLSGKSRSSELESDASAAMTMRVSDTCMQAEDYKTYVSVSGELYPPCRSQEDILTLYTTPSTN